MKDVEILKEVQHSKLVKYEWVRLMNKCSFLIHNLHYRKLPITSFKNILLK